MLSKIARIANNIPIHNKLIMTYFLVVAIPVLLVGVMLTNALRQLALDGAIRQSTESVEKIRKRTVEIMKVPIYISNEILVDNRLRKIVNTQYETTYDVVKAYSEYRDFEKYANANQEISNIRFYTKNATMLDNWEFFQEDESFSSRSEFQEALAAKGRIVWHYMPNETMGSGNEISLIRKIAYYADNSYGVLVVGVDPDVLNEMLREEPFETMLLTDDGYVAAAKDAKLVGHTVEQLQLNLDAVENANAGKSEFETEYDGKPSKIIVETYVPSSSLNGFKIISVIPVDTIVRDANRISTFSFLIIAASMAIAIVLILIFSNTLGRRIRRLSKEIKKLALGNFSAFSTIEGDDEFGQLSRHFNAMVGSIRSLMEEVAVANQQKNLLVVKQKEIKLKMLASQINPHFLFNTLETIRMKAHIRNEREIAHVVMLLGKLMRKNLELSGEKVPLAEEVERIRGYLEIQRFRYGERLNFTIDISEETLKTSIYPLLLQPLVENAIVHGLENKEEGGTVAVSARLRDGNLFLHVQDDGVGMTEEKARQVVNQLNVPEADAETRIGLRNVHQRIRLSYGEDYGIRIESEAGVGTRVWIIMPAEVDEDVSSAAGGR